MSKAQRITLYTVQRVSQTQSSREESGNGNSETALVTKLCYCAVYTTVRLPGVFTYYATTIDDNVYRIPSKRTVESFRIS